MNLPATRTKSNSGLIALDVAYLLLGMLLLVLAIRFTHFDDPNPAYNAWTYLLGIPAAMTVVSMLTRVLANDFVEKSIQVGFLISVLVHLVLTLFAINVVLFRDVWPSKQNETSAAATNLTKTPQYFEPTNSRQQIRPDYLKPVKTDSTEAEKPMDAQKLLNEPAKLDAMTAKDDFEPTLAEKPFEQPRKEPSPSQPSITSTAKQLERPDVNPSVDTSASQIEIPKTDVREQANAQDLKPTDLEQVRLQPDSKQAPLANQSFFESLPLGKLEKQNSAPKPDRRLFAQPKTNDAELDRALDRISEVLPIRPDSKQPLAANSDTVSELNRTRVPVPQSPSKSTLNSSVETSSTERPIILLERSSDSNQGGRNQAGLNPAIGNPTVAPSARRLSEAENRMRSQATPTQAPADSAFLNDPRFAEKGRLTGPGNMDSSGRLQAPIASGPIAIEMAVPSGSPDQATLNDAVGNGGLAEAMQSKSELDRSEIGRGTVSGKSGQSGAKPNSGLGATASPSAAMPSLEFNRDNSATAAIDLQRTGLDLIKGDRMLPEVRDVDITQDRFKRPDFGGPKIARSAVPIPAPAFSKRMDRNRDQEDISSKEFGLLGPQTEAAIESGLQFLAKYQRQDGSWSLGDFDEVVEIQSPSAATALALLSFQGAGYTHQQFKYQSQCKNALNWLVAIQKPNGDLYVTTDAKSDSNAWLYSHSIATLALCEAYGMTQDPEIKDNAQRAVRFLVQSQDPQGGGWRYQPRIGSDTSVTGWSMMALKSAELSGLEVPKESYLQIEKWLKGSQASEREKFLYRYNWQAPDTLATRHGRIPTPVMTSVGLLMRLYLGWRRDTPDMIQGADWLLQRLPAEGTAANPQRDTYYWYYSTQVLFHMGGDRWKAWYGSLYPMLIGSQAQAGPFRGSWEPNGPVPDAWGRFGGRLYVTTLNLLSLEVYYRHLPIYDATAD